MNCRKESVFFYVGTEPRRETSEESNLKSARHPHKCRGAAQTGANAAKIRCFQTVNDIAEMRVGGEGGIRTLDTVSRIHAFQASALSHSATSPCREVREAAHYSHRRRAGKQCPARASRRPIAGP